MIHTRLEIVAMAACATLALFPASSAQAQQVSTADIVSAELRTGWRTSDGTHMAALHLRLAEGWKTYWRSPGEAGIPPSFDWTGSENLSSVDLHWPRPVVFDQNGFRSIGYDTMLVLPIEFTPVDASQPMRLNADVTLGVCRDVCVPVDFVLRGSLPLPGAPDSIIETALRDRPGPALEAGLKSALCSVEPLRNGLRVTAVLDLPVIGTEEFAVLEFPDNNIWVSEAVTRRDGGTLTTAADVVSTTGAALSLDRSSMRITVLSTDRAVETFGCAAR